MDRVNKLTDYLDFVSRGEMNCKLELAIARPPAATWSRSGRWRRRVQIITAIVSLVILSARTVVAQTSINKMCPVMTEETVDPKFTTTYQGQVIGFCCDKCVAKFEANPGRYAARISELGDSSPKPSGQTRGTDADHAQTESAIPGGEQVVAIEHDSRENEHDETSADNHEDKHGHQYGQGFFAKLIGWLGKFHPLTVHFPIAMLLGAALAEAILIATGRQFFIGAGRYCLWVGSIGAVAASVLGWFFGGFHWADDSWILTTHRWLGTTTAAWSVLLLIHGEQTFRRSDTSRTKYRAILFIGAGLVGITGFFGGSLIYGLTHFVWP